MKRAQADHDDLDTFSPAFPDELFAGDGTMVTYSEIFPFDEGFRCANDQVEWIVKDNHCVNPRCSCCRPVLSFLRVSRGGGRTAREVAAADYDYTSATFEATMVAASRDLDGVSEKQILEAIKGYRKQRTRPGLTVVAEATA